MNEKLLKLLEDIDKKKLEVKNLVDENKLDEAEAAKAELVDLQKKFDILKDIEDKRMEEVINGIGVIEITPGRNNPVHDFAQAARRGFAVDASKGYGNEGEGAEGGYTVPEDIQTKINEYKEASFSLETLVDIESVSTNSGRRTFQKKGQHSGFTSVEEAGAIGKVAGPQFETLNYTIKKYAGYMPVTNELLADSDANITNVLVKWLGDEDVATRNKLILAAIESKGAEEVAGLDGIKKAINVTLGQAFAGSVKIITNDDGFNWLDTLKDKNEQYLLKPNLNPQAPIPYSLAVGARTIPVVVVPNNVLKTGTSGIPMIIGDLKEAIKLFDRKGLTLLSSNIAAAGDFNAYAQDMTLFRAIERLAVVVKDKDAFVNGYIKVSSTTNG